MKNLSIGVFDSGMGGLTVLRELRSLLPHEHFLYLGDTARLPYGNRSAYTVTKYSLENALFLLTKGIKLLVIACNTSSALSLNIIKKKLPVPVIGVIEAGAREASRQTARKRVGVIGTKGTINSHAYVRAITKIDPAIAVFGQSCPLFVPIVEEGLEQDRVALLMAEKYLSGFAGKEIDVLVMGCTHYPVLQEVIQKVVGPDVSIVHTGRETAKEVRAVLEAKHLLRTKSKGITEYFVTDAPEAFREIGSRILGGEIEKVRRMKGSDFRDSLLSS